MLKYLDYEHTFIMFAAIIGELKYTLGKKELGLSALFGYLLTPGVAPLFKTLRNVTSSKKSENL